MRKQLFSETSAASFLARENARENAIRTNGAGYAESDIRNDSISLFTHIVIVSTDFESAIQNRKTHLLTTLF